MLFNERCSGCHTLDRANSYGSKPEGQLKGGERTNGPNFNVRKVKAIRCRCRATGSRCVLLGAYAVLSTIVSYLFSRCCR